MARDFTELRAWQDADVLRAFIHEHTKEGPPARDFKFKEQIRDAADGGPRSVAEGLPGTVTRTSPGSSTSPSAVDEVKDALRAGKLRGFFSEEVYKTGLKKADRARGAMLRLLKHLRSTDPPRPWADE